MSQIGGHIFQQSTPLSVQLASSQYICVSLPNACFMYFSCHHYYRFESASSLDQWEVTSPTISATEYASMQLMNRPLAKCSFDVSMYREEKNGLSVCENTLVLQSIASG